MKENDSLERSEPPAGEEIESLFKEFRFQPGSRYYQRMENQPWKRRGGVSLWSRTRPWGLPALLTLGLILVLALSLTAPSLEVLANRFAQFFNTAPGEQITIQIPIEDLTDPEARFNLSIPEAERLAGFQARIPASLPPGFSFSGAEYHPARNAIILNYASEAGGILRISQRPIGVEYQNVSANADVEMVQIGQVTGEYVAGGWTAKSAEIPDETPDIEITLQAIWDPDAGIQILRWQENEAIYEIIFGGGCPGNKGCLDKNDLINLAEDLQ